MTHRTDTLICNTERLTTWQSDPAYNYNRELMTPEVDLYQLFIQWLGRFLEKIFGSYFAEKYTEPILICLFIAVILFILWFLYRKRPELFMRSGKRQLAYNVQEDTIYGVDFSVSIAEALKRADYKEAVRLLYLRTLRELSDGGVIDWQLYKTPTEYIYEVKPEQGREPFRELTNGFLRVRYGNFEATEALFNEMDALSRQIKKGGNV